MANTNELRECQAALSALLADEPQLASRICGSTTLGNRLVHVQAALEAAKNYSDRVKCTSCENGHGPNGCTDCLNTGYDPQAFAGGIDQALNDAYAEGRKDERDSLSQAARSILAERQRQIEQEGYTAEHDDQHSYRELVRAAICYAREDMDATEHAALWPWEASAFKTKGTAPDLIKAGALIVAALDRYYREVDERCRRNGHPF